MQLAVKEYSIKELQQITFSMFENIVAICKKNNITYYCQAGTVLGAVRHKGLIPWDYDIDIIIPNNQIDLFIRHAQKELNSNYYVDYYTVNSKTLRQFPRIGLRGYSTNIVHVDIFRLIGLPANHELQLKMVSEANHLTKMNAYMRINPVKLLLKGKIKLFIIRLINREKYINAFNSLCCRFPYDESEYVMNPSGKYKEKNIFKKTVYGKGLITTINDLKVVIPFQYDLYLKQYYGDYMQYPQKKEIEENLNKTYILKKIKG